MTDTTPLRSAAKTQLDATVVNIALPAIPYARRTTTDASGTVAR